MESPRGWAIIFIVYLSLKGAKVYCQNVAPGSGCSNVLRDCSRSNPTSTELLNSIFTAAACNGALPDLIPIMQGQAFGENIPRSPLPQELTIPLSIIPMPVPGCPNPQEPIIISSQAIRSPVPNPNVIATTSFPPAPVLPPNVIPNLQQNIVVPAPPPPICTPPIAQTVSLENYPMGLQNIGVVRPLQVLQPQCQFNELNSYNPYNPIFEPVGLSDINIQPLNLPILPPPPVLPTINTCSGNLDLTPLISQFLSQPTILTSDGQQLPLNLQINVPTPNVQAPRITVVSPTPTNGPTAPTPCGNDFPAGLPPVPYPYLPPIILGKSKSSWRNLLPIILVSLFNDRGCNNGGGCGCCCSCNSSNSGNTIPIPYPIPIPVNNPIINTCPYPYSRSREYRDDGDYEDRKK